MSQNKLINKRLNAAKKRYVITVDCSSLTTKQKCTLIDLWHDKLRGKISVAPLR